MTLQIQKMGTAPTPPRIFIYGGPGIGKSTVAAQSYKPVFLPTEDGLDQIPCDAFPISRTYEEFKAHLASLLTEEHSYRTAVIDTVDWLEPLIFSRVCTDYHATAIEKVDGGYGKGFSYALEYWAEVKNLLQELRDTKRMAVIFISHAMTKEIHDPETGDMTQYIPKIHARAASFLMEWCDAVLYLTRQHGAARGEDGGERVFRTSPSVRYYAKNRYNLPGELPLYWKALQDSISRNLPQQKKEQTHGAA